MLIVSSVEDLNDFVPSCVNSTLFCASLFPKIARSPMRYDLEDRLVRFAADVCRLATRLSPTAIGKHITVQVVRSGTSPLANYGEVQGAESRRDFVHKLGICVKELRETRAWLKLLMELHLSPEDPLTLMLKECDELLAITTSSIRTARQNGTNPG